MKTIKWVNFSLIVIFAAALPGIPGLAASLFNFDSPFNTLNIVLIILSIVSTICSPVAIFYLFHNYFIYHMASIVGDEKYHKRWKESTTVRIHELQMENSIHSLFKSQRILKKYFFRKKFPKVLDFYKNNQNPSETKV